MRIMTWNINRPGTRARVQAVLNVLSEIDPDIALLQEVRPTRTLIDVGNWIHAEIGPNSRKYGERGRYDWGSAVWSPRLPLGGVRMPDPLVGWATGASFAHDGTPGLAVSLHSEVVEG